MEPATRNGGASEVENQPATDEKIEALVDQGDSLLEQGHYAPAAACFEEACQLLRSRPDCEEHLGAVLSRLGVALKEAGAFGKSEKILCESQALALKNFGEDHEEFVDALGNLAGLYKEMGSNSRALRLYEQCREIQEKIGGQDQEVQEKQLSYASTLHNLGGLHRQMGSYNQALPLYEQSREIVRKAVGEEHQFYASSLLGLAGLYEEMGSYSQALSLYEQCRDIARRTKGEEHLSYGKILHNLAGLYVEMGSYREALSLFEQSLEIKRKTLGEDHQSYSVTLHNIAQLYEKMGAYSQALPLYERSREIDRKTLGEEHAAYGTSLHNLAGLYRKMNDYAAALPLYLECQDIQRKTLGEEHPFYGSTLDNLAGILKKMGAFTQALALYEQSLEIQRKTLGEEHPYYGSTLHNLAGLHENMGSYSQALALYEECREIDRKTLGEDHPDYASGLLSFARFCARRRIGPQALQYARQSCDIRNKLLQRTMGVLSTKDRLAFVKLLETSLKVYVGVVIADTAEHVAPCFQIVAAQKNLTYDLQAAEVDLDPEDSSAAAELRKNLLLARRRLAQAALERRPDGHGAGSAAKYQEALQEVEKLEQHVGRDMTTRDICQGASGQESMTSSLASRLPSGTALAEFVFYITAEGTACIAAFVLLSDASVTLLDLAPVDELQELATTFQRSLRPSKRSHSKHEKRLKAGRGLRAKLLDPVLKAAGPITHLFLALDGFLSKISFVALSLDTNDSFQYVLDLDFSISYLTAGRDLLRLRTPTADGSDRQHRCRIVANPEFGAAVSPAQFRGQCLENEEEEEEDVEFCELEGTQHEADGIVALLREAPGLNVVMELLTGKEATKERLSSFSEPPWLMHVATHGFYVDPADTEERLNDALKGVQEPLLRCGVALAGAQLWELHGPSADRCNGILTGLELRHLNLHGTKLVTLSACETGLGDNFTGQGVHGLGRAVQLAGAESVVMSLWTVADEQTCELMCAFYKELLQESGGPFHLAKALKAAQKELRDQPALCDKPFFWAAFTLHGAVGPIVT